MKRSCLLFATVLIIASCQVNIGQPSGGNTNSSNAATKTDTDDEPFPEKELQCIVADQAQIVAQHYISGRVTLMDSVTAEPHLPLQKVSEEEYIVDGTYTFYEHPIRTLSYSCNMHLKRGGTLIYPEDWVCTEFYMDGKRKKIE